MLTILATSLTFSTPASAAPVTSPCPYETGATQTWTKTSSGTAGEVVQTVQLRVVSSTDALVSFDVTTSLVRLDARDPVMASITEALDAQSLAARVVLDRSSASLSLGNGAALQAVYVAAGEQAVTALREAAAPQALLTLVPQLMADPDLMEQSVLRDLKPLLSMSCSTLDTGTSTYTTELPSPFGEARLPASGVLEVTADAEALIVRNTETIDAEALQASAMEAMTGMAVQLEGATEADKAAALKLLGGVRFEAGTELVTILDPVTGWAKDVSSTRTVRGPDQERLDRVRFTLAP